MAFSLELPSPLGPKDGKPRSGTRSGWSRLMSRSSTSGRNGGSGCGTVRFWCRRAVIGTTLTSESGRQSRPTGNSCVTRGTGPIRPTESLLWKRKTMGKVVKKPKRLVVLDLDETVLRGLKVRGAVLCQGREEIARSMRRASPRSFWISTKQEATDDVLRSAQQCRYRRGPISGLVTLEPPRPNSIPGLNSCFRRLAGAAPDSKLLPLEELLDVLSAPPERSSGFVHCGRSGCPKPDSCLDPRQLEDDHGAVVDVQAIRRWCPARFQPVESNRLTATRCVLATTKRPRTRFSTRPIPSIVERPGRNCSPKRRPLELRFVVCESRRASPAATSLRCRQRPLLASSGMKWRSRTGKHCGPSQFGSGVEPEEIESY